jgi:hypothetical protein
MNRARALLSVAALAVVLVSAPPAHADTGAKFTTIDFTSRMSSTGTNLQTMPGGHTFGRNDLTGTTRWGNQAAAVDFLATVDYTNGSGPFDGFVTLTRADGTKLSLRTDGHALAVPETSGGTITFFSGSVTVIQGTGAFRGATGIGTMTGSRSATLGSPVKLTFRLKVLRK